MILQDRLCPAVCSSLRPVSLMYVQSGSEDLRAAPCMRPVTLPTVEPQSTPAGGCPPQSLNQIDTKRCFTRPSEVKSLSRRPLLHPSGFMKLIGLFQVKAMTSLKYPSCCAFNTEPYKRLMYATLSGCRIRKSRLSCRKVFLY